VADNGVGMDRVELRQCLNLGSAGRLVNPISPRMRNNGIGQFSIGRSTGLAAAFLVRKNL
jgi:HSP90 family molecular chaperone